MGFSNHLRPIFWLCQTDFSPFAQTGQSLLYNELIMFSFLVIGKFFVELPYTDTVPDQASNIARGCSLLRISQGKYMPILRKIFGQLRLKQIAHRRPNDVMTRIRKTYAPYRTVLHEIYLGCTQCVLSGTRARHECHWSAQLPTRWRTTRETKLRARVTWLTY